MPKPYGGNTSQIKLYLQSSETILECSLQERLGKRSNITKMERDFKEAKLVILGHISHIGVSRAKSQPTLELWTLKQFQTCSKQKSGLRNPQQHKINQAFKSCKHIQRFQILVRKKWPRIADQGVELKRTIKEDLYAMENFTKETKHRSENSCLLSFP